MSGNTITTAQRDNSTKIMPFSIFSFFDTTADERISLSFPAIFSPLYSIVLTHLSCILKLINVITKMMMARIMAIALA